MRSFSLMRIVGILLVVLVALGPATALAAKQRSIVFVLIDDMRFDSMSCMNHPFLKTPALDKLAGEGVRFNNAFVTTSLCSPSRASFLTGTYAHRHGVLNNATLLDPTLPTFPAVLQEAGYKTAFIGKWHMGWHNDNPRPGFNHWASFLGQGDYVKNKFNINGTHKVIEGYVTDVLTDMAADWIKANHEKPFMLYLSHKAVHGWFTPPPRYADSYSEVPIELPDSGLDTPDNYYRKPKWVQAQRDSWHGLNDAYYKKMSMPEVIRDYNRAMRAVDDSVAKVVATLKALGIFDETLVVFTSDNGFLFGEHGLIDKRCMYEESIRIPMIMSCPAMFKGGRTLDQMVLNIDVAPTFLAAAGVETPEEMHGNSFLTLPVKPDQPWRTSFLYEYFWEPAFPKTPSMLGVRTDKYKFVEYQGIWDSNELYDLEKDPQEMHNHISTSHRKEVTVDTEYQPVYQEMQKELRRLTAEYGALDLPSWRKH